MITTQAQLKTLLDTIKDEPLLALDTEFIRRDTYYPILCLIQLATPKHQFIIDALTLSDLTLLFDKLYDRKTKWIVHASTQDIQALQQLSNQVPKLLFDTQIASDLLNNQAQISYQNLCGQLLNVEIDKTHTCFNWQIRPLPVVVIDYALNDVKYLFDLYHQLNTQLNRQKRLEWMQEEINHLLHKMSHPDLPQHQWKKLSGISKLTKEYYPKAQQLTAWREITAIIHNKPKQWILSDKTLYAIITGQNQLPKKWQTDFLKFKQKNPLSNQLKLMNSKLNASEQKYYKTLKTYINTVAKQYRINPQIMANKKTLIKLIKGQTDTLLHQGWRYQILKEYLF